MVDDELEELRRRKLQELQRQQGDDESQAAEEQAARQQYEAQKEAILRQILEPEARDRLARVQLARPDVARSLEQQLVALHQQGRIRGLISDDLLKQFLSRLQSSNKREINITRR